MSDRRRFLKGLTSLPLATVLASPRLAAAVSAGLYRRSRPSSRMAGPSRLRSPGRRARPTAASYWCMSGGDSFISVDARERCGFPIG